MNSRSQPTDSGGFTLIELLAAMAVLGILGLLIVQVTSATSTTTRISNRRVDAAAQARMVFERLGTDLNAVVSRSDAVFKAGYPAGGGDVLDFLSAVTGPDPESPPTGYKNRGYSRILYRMEKRTENKGRLCLVRAAKAVGWTDRGFMGLKGDGFPMGPGDVGYPSGLAVLPKDYDILAGGVIALAVGFQLYPDNLPVYFEGDSAPSTLQGLGQIVYRPPMRGPATTPTTLLNSYVDSERISAIVVGLVVVDLDALHLLDVAAADQLAAVFTGTPSDGKMPVETWMEDTKNLTDLPNVPPPVKQAIRLYQRAFAIHPYGSGER